MLSLLHLLQSFPTHYYLGLASLIFSLILATPALPRMSSFPILSILFISIIHLNMCTGLCVRMPWTDFCANFTSTAICYIVNTRFFTLAKSHNESVFNGQWIQPDRAGGCKSCSSVFLDNPQVQRHTFPYRVCQVF